jgi:hypothetical protein
MKKMIMAFMATMFITASGCSLNTVTALEIIINEGMGDGEMGTSRTLITDDYMRLDDGTDNSESYLILDRKQNVIYSVYPAERSVVKISYKDVDIESPIPLDWEEHIRDDHDFEQKTFLNKPVKRYVITSGDKMCFEAYYIEGFLPEASAAEIQFLKIIASDHKRVLSSVPADQVEACDLIINVFHPGSHLKHGYPIGVSNGLSYRRIIKSYNERAKVDKSLFTIPEEFEVMTPEMIMPLMGN